MRFIRTLAISCTALMVCSAALAQDVQPGRGGQERGARQRQRVQPLSPEKLHAAWKWQAVTVAHDLKLDQANADKLTEVYVASRKELHDAMQAWREEMREQRRQEGGQGEQGERGRRGGMRGGNRELVDDARTNLESSLKSLLSDEQTTKAMASLGTFNGQWDRMVDTILGFSLEPENMHAALAATNVYVASMTNLRESGDREAMREGFREIREQLQTDLSKALSDEQMETMLASTRMRGGQRPNRGEPGQRPGRGAGRDDAPSATPTVTKATIGEPAPNFTLADESGKTYTLADYKGRIVVLQWINPDCPVCRGKASSGAVTQMAKEMKASSGDIVHLTINSTHYMEPKTSADYLKKHKINAPALADRDGKVGKLYDARTTPHLYVIDAEGILRYNGAIDDQKGNNYVVQVVRQIVEGETVSPDTTRPYGCNVKYKQ